MESDASLSPHLPEQPQVITGTSTEPTKRKPSATEKPPSGDAVALSHQHSDAPRPAEKDSIALGEGLKKVQERCEKITELEKTHKEAKASDVRFIEDMHKHFGEVGKISLKGLVESLFLNPFAWIALAYVIVAAPLGSIFVPIVTFFKDVHRQRIMYQQLNLAKNELIEQDKVKPELAKKLITNKLEMLRSKQKIEKYEIELQSKDKEIVRAQEAIDQFYVGKMWAARHLQSVKTSQHESDKAQVPHYERYLADYSPEKLQDLEGALRQAKAARDSFVNENLKLLVQQAHLEREEIDIREAILAHWDSSQDKPSGDKINQEREALSELRKSADTTKSKLFDVMGQLLNKGIKVEDELLQKALKWVSKEELDRDAPKAPEKMPQEQAEKLKANRQQRFVVQFAFQAATRELENHKQRIEKLKAEIEPQDGVERRKFDEHEMAVRKEEIEQLEKLAKTLEVRLYHQAIKIENLKSDEINIWRDMINAWKARGDSDSGKPPENEINAAKKAATEMRFVAYEASRALQKKYVENFSKVRVYIGQDEKASIDKEYESLERWTQRPLGYPEKRA